jgi:hypothetical protein
MERKWTGKERKGKEKGAPFGMESENGTERSTNQSNEPEEVRRRVGGVSRQAEDMTKWRSVRKIETR